MIWGHALNVARRVVAGIASPARYLRRKLAPISGRAKNTRRSGRPVDPLLSRKEALATQLAKAKRHHKRSRAICLALRAVNHEILARGLQ